MRAKVLWSLVVASLLGGSVANAAPIMYVHDGSGNLAKVDVVTGAVDVIGNTSFQMTDIAFDPSGNLYGIGFGNLFAINATTAVATVIGSHNVPGGNALVFGSDGTLYAAGGDTSLYALNPATAAATNLGNTGFSSGGDLAFYNGELYLASSGNELVHLDLTNIGASAAVGPFGFSSVFGLATGDNNVLYGVAGTQIFSVNAATGAGSNPVNFGGQGLGPAFGQSFFTESGAPPPPPPPIPEPASLLLLGTGLVTWRALRRT